MKPIDESSPQRPEVRGRAVPPVDRRSEPRRTVSGRVSLCYRDPGVVLVNGRLLDVSAGGFRVRHTHAGLATGCEVRFSYGANAGTARVVWTRHLGEEIESGFRILERGALQ